MITTWRRLAAAMLALSMLAPVAGAGDIPRLANGKPDFSGIWQSSGVADYDLEPHGPRKDAPPGAGVIDGKFIPYKPEALARRQKNFAVRATNDPRLKCWTLGVPRSVYFPAPFQILQRERDLTLLHQFGHQVRTIHTNQTLHPEERQEFWLGDSRGHWDGDTLVVDVVDFHDETWLDRAGNYHGLELHVVERWKLLDANTIEYRATLEDPEVYTRPWTLTVHLHRNREPNAQLIEDYCFTLDFDQHYPPKKD